jgi:predicted nucleotidyltransferase
MYGLTDKSYNELLKILASIPEIEEALIYGSRARGDFWRASDVDLSIKGKDFTRHTLARLNDKLYESHIPLFFDTHVYANIKNPKFKANVDREGKVLYRKNSSFYSGKPTDPGNAIGGFINSSYDNYKYFLSVSNQMSNEDYLLTYKAQFKEWHDCLALPLNHNYIIMKRGEFQVFLNVHTRCCDIASAVGAWDYLIELCEDMLTLRRESSNILKYLGRAYAGKGDLTKAAQFYVEAAAMVSIEYPRYPQNGDDSRPAKEIKNELRQEMRSMGLDPNLIN